MRLALTTLLSLTLTACGGDEDTSRTEKSDPPTITTEASYSTPFGTSTDVALTVTDDDITTLTFAASSDNGSLYPASGLTFQGEGTDAPTLRLEPAAGESGTANITVTVTDADDQTADATFAITVEAPIAPVIAAIRPWEMPGNDSIEIALALTTGDVADNTFTATADNDTLVPAASLAIAGNGSAPVLTITPAVTEAGDTTITVTTTDTNGLTDSTTFGLHVFPATDWIGIRQSGLSNAQYGAGVVGDSVGNIYTMTENWNGFVGELQKYNRNGDTGTLTSLTAPQGFIPRDMTIGSDDKIYVASQAKVVGGSNAQYATVDAYDTLGNPLWRGVLGRDDDYSSESYGYHVHVAADGQVYLAGEARMSASSGCDNGAFVARFDPTSDSVTNDIRQADWVGLIGHQNGGCGAADLRGYIHGMVVDADNNLYVAGSTQTDLDGDGAGPFGGYDGFIRKYDASGTEQWTRMVGSTGNDFLRRMVMHPDGFIYVVGLTNGEVESAPVGVEDGLLIKIATDGTIAWTKQIDDDNTGNRFYAIAVTHEHNLAISGSTAEVFNGSTMTQARAAVWTYNTSGEQQWVHALGDAVDRAFATHIAVVETDILVAGQTNGSMPGMSNPTGEMDAFFARFKYDGTAR